MKYLPLLLLFAACRTAAPIIQSEMKDSTSVKVTARVDTFWMPGEELRIPIYIKCDSVTNKPIPIRIKKAGKHVKVSVGLDGKGLLTVRCKDDSLMVVTKQLDSVVFRLRSDKKITQLPSVVTHTPYWFDVLFRWWALLTALLLVWRYRKGALTLLTRLIG